MSLSVILEWFVSVNNYSVTQLILHVLNLGDCYGLVLFVLKPPFLNLKTHETIQQVEAKYVVIRSLLHQQ